LAGDGAVLARRYASALYELAAKDGKLDLVADELRALQKLSVDSEDFRTVLTCPLFSRGQTAVIMKQLAEAGHLDVLVSKFLALLARNRRLALLPPIADAFAALLAEARHEYRVSVSVARPLAFAQEQGLVGALQKIFGGKVFLDQQVEPSLLGGLIVKFGSRQIDASLRGKLARLEKQLKAQREAA
jgi:F-type H+-transporting ATPase subunit delta